MTERERLIELLKNAKLCSYPFGDQYSDSTIGKIADYLLANGVIVPPCKVGDTVYEILPKAGYIRAVNVVGFHLGKFPTLRGHKRKEYFVGYLDQYLLHIRIDDIGKTVFLTREEAEKALAERSKA